VSRQHRELDLPAPERFLILPHPDVAAREREKVADRDAWLVRMRAFQHQMLQVLELPA
jgi:hypothetical protein